MGNVENFEKLLLEEPKREQLFPLFEEVFGIQVKHCMIFQREVIGMIHIKLYHFTRR